MVTRCQTSVLDKILEIHQKHQKVTDNPLLQKWRVTSLERSLSGGLVACFQIFLPIFWLSSEVLHKLSWETDSHVVLEEQLSLSK